MRHLTSLFAALAASVAATQPLHKRQEDQRTLTDSEFWTFWTFTSSSTYPALPKTTSNPDAIAEDPVAYNVQRLCYPNYYKAAVADIDVQEYWDKFWPTVEDSPFPCEQVIYIKQACSRLTREAYELDSSANNTHDTNKTLIEAERACICPSRYWEMTVACASCYAVHGTAQKYLDYWLAQTIAEEKFFCNTTVPDRLSGPRAPFDLQEPYESTTTTLQDEAPDKTEVSYYYTQGVMPKGLDENWEPANTGSATIDWKKFTQEVWTKASTFATTGSTVPTAPSFSQRISSPDASTSATVAAESRAAGASAVSSDVVEAAGAASTAGAVASKDVKVAGGVVMAVLGGIALL